MQDFKWTQFYEEFADKLLEHKDDRTGLMAAIHELPSVPISVLEDKPTKDTTEPMGDICPFTVFGLFNKYGERLRNRKRRAYRLYPLRRVGLEAPRPVLGLRQNIDQKRIAIASELAEFLGVKTPVPDLFEGIPLVVNYSSSFFNYKYRRDEHDIDILWELFATALEYADNPGTDSAKAFSTVYEKEAKQRVGHLHRRGWCIYTGLCWIRPWKYLPLDHQSQYYITKRLGLTIGNNGERGVPSAKDYLDLIDTLEKHFQEDNYPAHSFPELYLAASKKSTKTRMTNRMRMRMRSTRNTKMKAKQERCQFLEPYTIDDIIADGCFLEPEIIEEIIAQLHRKKNLILQGPPGTGKTWLARKLAYALMGQKDNSSLCAVQFHPTMSYEDFVRGWRPSGDDKLALVDGPFLEMINKASKNPNVEHVVVIEEINRGNPAQIFGEMLTLLEADKRKRDEELKLIYSKEADERIYIPKNLYVIGTMNIADRSLALVDLALRRRFAFFDLEPTLGKRWRNWVKENAGIDITFLKDIEKRLVSLNKEISDDPKLGEQYRIGHSYVTPNTEIEDPAAWFRWVVEHEIYPLLEEYLFDNLELAKKMRNDLVEGIEGT